MGQGQSSNVSNDQIKAAVDELKTTTITKNDDVQNKILNIATNNVTQCPEGYTFNDKFSFMTRTSNSTQNFSKPNVCTILPTAIYSMSVLSDNSPFPMPEKLSCPANSMLIIDDTNATFTNGVKQNSTPYCVLNQADSMLKKCKYGISVDIDTGISTCNTYEDISAKNNSNCKNKVYDINLKQEVCSDKILENKTLVDNNIKVNQRCANSVYDKNTKAYKCLDRPTSQNVSLDGGVAYNNVDTSGNNTAMKMDTSDTTNTIARDMSGNNTAMKMDTSGTYNTMKQ